jgi:ABC-type transporter Mla MlaB component
LTKAITLLALTCVLVAGVAATSILFQDSVPVASTATEASVARNPESNREAKHDKLAVVQFATASIEPAPQQQLALTEPLRQAYASSSPADIEAARIVETTKETTKVATRELPSAPVQPSPEATKPKIVAKPQIQKSYALLSDGQIAGIKERLKLSSSQEYYWPGVETALRALARKLNAARMSNPNATAAQIDPDCEEVQQLKSAAMPLLFQLRDDQKEEVRKLARVIGLEKVASAI